MKKSAEVVRNFMSGRDNQQANMVPDEQAAADDYYSFDSQLEMSRVAPGMYKPIPEQTILEWIAPSRPFRKRNKQFFTTVLVIALLISMILFFSGQFLPIAMVFSVVFLNYVLAVIPPQEIKYEITNFGIKMENRLYSWQELGRFWFDKKYDDFILHVETAEFPGRLTIVLPESKKKDVSEILSEVLLNQKPPLSTFEKIAKWVQEKFPLD